MSKQYLPEPGVMIPVEKEQFINAFSVGGIIYVLTSKGLYRLEDNVLKLIPLEAQPSMYAKKK